MKKVAFCSLAVMALAEIADYAGCYSMGYGGWLWGIFNPFLTGPIFLISALVFLVSTVIMLRSRETRASGIGLLVAFFLWFGLTAVRALPPPGAMAVYGIRNRIMETETLDDLRQFARAIKLGNVKVLHGELESGDPVKYHDLQQKHSFLKRDPIVLCNDNSVEVFWGGALAGHWGFMLFLDGKSPDLVKDRAYVKVLQVSDDVVFVVGSD